MRSMRRAAGVVPQGCDTRSVIECAKYTADLSWERAGRGGRPRTLLARGPK